MNCVPDDEVADVWSNAIKAADEQGGTITAKLVREHTEPFRPLAKKESTLPEDAPFDPEARAQKLGDWLDVELPG